MGISIRFHEDAAIQDIRNLVVQLRDGQVRTNDLLTQIEKGAQQLMATLKDLQAEIATLQQSVAAETTVEQSAITLLSGLTSQLATVRQQLADAITNQDPAAMQAALNALVQVQTTVDANKSTLAAAVAANTPAASTGTTA